jgi:lysophospholipase L1-like esterase
MESFLQRIDHGEPDILLIGPPPMQLGEWVPSASLIDASRQLNAQYRALSENLGITFADSGHWQIPMAFDGVHFTEEGHIAFADALFHHLKHHFLRGSQP